MFCVVRVYIEDSWAFSWALNGWWMYTHWALNWAVLTTPMIYGQSDTPSFYPLHFFPLPSQYPSRHSLPYNLYQFFLLPFFVKPQQQYFHSHVIRYKLKPRPINKLFDLFVCKQSILFWTGCYLIKRLHYCGYFHLRCKSNHYNLVRYLILTFNRSNSWGQKCVFLGLLVRMRRDNFKAQKSI